MIVTHITHTPSRRAILVVTSIATVAVIGLWIWKKRKVFEALTGQFEKVGKISKLIIYPVKSLPGIEVENAECTEIGLRVGLFRDRQWLIVKKNGHFVHLRLEPTLALTSTSLHDDQLWIDGPTMETLKLTVRQKVNKTDKIFSCSLWTSETIGGVDCGDEAANWFNRYLNRDDLRLVQYVEGFQARSQKRAWTYFFPDPVGITYHDDGSVHVLTDKSLEDLNSRLQEKISHRNFRPGILVTGTNKPYAEDDWKFLKTGTAILMFSISCGRCIATTVNPDTGERTNKDPLTTLKTYREATLPADKKNWGLSPLFGIYMGSYRKGVVKKGDDVFAVICPRK